jgi:hypothetical protein
VLPSTLVAFSKYFLSFGTFHGADLLRSQQPVPIAHEARATCLWEVLMTENTMPTNTGHQSEPTDSEPAVPQPSQDQAELSDSELQLTQAPSSTTCTAPGRKPLFGR